MNNVKTCLGLNKNEDLPESVMDIIAMFEHDENTYEACKALQEALYEQGYSIEWGLDAEPNNLRKIT